MGWLWSQVAMENVLCMLGETSPNLVCFIFYEGKFGGSFWTYGGGLDAWFYCEQGGIVLVVVVVVVVVIGVGYSANCNRIEFEESLKMSENSRSPPPDRRIRRERTSYRDAPYRRDFRRSARALGFANFLFLYYRNDLCNNCKRPGHFARECQNAAVCNNCGLPGHIASECTVEAICWNCKEPGHMASNCPNEGICHTCGKAGHLARECSSPQLLPGDMRLCNNCYKPGHIAIDCTNEKACNNCRKTGHFARDCQNEPVCNLCNVAGHVARQCPKSEIFSERSERGGGDYHGGFRDVICRNCNQVGHKSWDCMGPLMICHNCGGRGHMAYECPSGRFMDYGFRRY
ncbi:hypothetical protein ZIOFF_013671 [Zingiber officinale]|uniref:CCHC-type domain-containing protein n=1 Tax=Zingiber officinale TaxID=94328 RepID=A0A8J5LQH8_ZINOF|nr:hypothetical protein ZIOFF_013671 [Zingiber officinale]